MNNMELVCDLLKQAHDILSLSSEPPTRNYDQKDSVVWLCQLHHRETHRLGKELNYGYSW